MLMWPRRTRNRQPKCVSHETIWKHNQHWGKKGDQLLIICCVYVHMHNVCMHKPLSPTFITYRVVSSLLGQFHSPLIYWFMSKGQMCITPSMWLKTCFNPAATLKPWCTWAPVISMSHQPTRRWGLDTEGLVNVYFRGFFRSLSRC